MNKISKSERTREFIIERTAGIFNTKGYAGTSMADLTNATKLTKGSIYGNFENKEEVALAAFDYNWKTVQDIVKREMAKKTTNMEQLLVYVSTYESFFKYPFPVGGCPILNTATESDDTHPALRKRAADALISWKNAIVRLVDRGISAGEIKPETDAEQIALTIMAMIEGVIMITKATGNINYWHKVMRSVEQLILDLAV